MKHLHNGSGHNGFAKPRTRGDRSSRSTSPSSCATIGGLSGGGIRLGISADEGIFVEGSEAVARQGGSVIDCAPLGLLGGVGAEHLPDHLLTALFPDRQFCYSQPAAFRRVRARIGPAELAADLDAEAVPLSALYEPSFYESFDGDIYLSSAGGSDYRASFREWRRNVANLEGYPERYRRVVDISLPEALSDHRDDTVLLWRLGRLVCELVDIYVKSEGERESLVYPGMFTNLFRGGEAPPALAAPALSGRRISDAYRKGRAEALLPG